MRRFNVKDVLRIWGPGGGENALEEGMEILADVHRCLVWMDFEGWCFQRK